ncbi:MAG: phosphoribosylamine--glycine ligase [Candidatus Borkfalkiaceae bacterium]|nr:phosphoribosylamine--glycine ligase [Clostridia bacterium]MDY6223140.1 phosphoribosylamine--glycine ligase [Christensenellaceae bacterium]
MNILVVGGGGREHAIVKKLKESKKAEKIYVLPGNGGIESDAECEPVKATDLQGIVRFAEQKKVDFAVVAPDDPLVMGCVDLLEERGIPCFGPRKNAAIIEGSKVFSKNLMKKYGIPTAASETFTSAEEAIDYLKTAPYPAVIKADGLALGKGVIIAATFEEAKDAVNKMMCEKAFGESGSRILVEEFLSGPEVSVLSFTDGETVVPMVSAMDHKRAEDGDKGLNTGGMGAVAPNPYYTEETAKECMEKIFLPTVRAMKAEGRPFSGCLYFGLMLTKDGPKVIEYNCRFGDPETQAVLPLLKSDLLEIMLAVREKRLRAEDVRFSSGATCCVVLASRGYPVKYQTGYQITLPQTGENEYIYVAGAKREGGALKTSGGRVLGVVAAADTLQDAVKNAYALAEKIRFENAYMRRDIGERALKALPRIGNQGR